LAICTASAPTPLPAAWTSTLSPGRSTVEAVSMKYAVRPCIGSTASTESSASSGAATHSDDEAISNSA
jgi:hypothetical protein